MANSCCFGLEGNLDFPEFLQKKFYNNNYRNWFYKTNTHQDFGKNNIVFAALESS